MLIAINNKFTRKNQTKNEGVKLENFPLAPNGQK